MKRIAILLLVASVCYAANAQKKNGTVYSEHEMIDKSRALWAAFVNDDKELFLSSLADSVHLFVNGYYSIRSRESFESVIEWWEGVFNKKATDDKGTYPDAIEYEKGGTWVQDWIRFTGTHDKSGVNINVQVHGLYLFNEQGKVLAWHQYFDDSFNEEISKALNPSTLSAKDREYILNNYKVMEESWNKGDRTPYINRYNERTFYMVPNQELLEGVDAIRAFVNSFPKLKTELEPVEIWGSANQAGVRGIYKNFDAQGNLFDKGKFISSWQKDKDGNWNITHDIWNSDFAPQD
ncbi:MAG: hypothetical protein ABFS12_12295 [Bacteroidota bacterium]